VLSRQRISRRGRMGTSDIQSAVHAQFDVRSVGVIVGEQPADASSADTQPAFADAVNVAAFFLTKSCTCNGPCPVSVRTSSDIRS
jgi:hypothetical protein